MSEDSTGALGPLIGNVTRSADGLLGFLQVGNLHPVTRRRSEWELEGAEKTRTLAAALRAIDSMRLPVQVRIGLKKLEPLFFDLVRRWEWDRVIGDEGDGYLTGKRKHWHEQRRAFHAAALSYMEAIASGASDEQPGDGHIYWARTAEREHIPAATPPITTAEAINALYEAWMFTPCLAPNFPTLKDGEYPMLQNAITELRDAARELSANASQRQDTSGGKQEPFVVRTPGGVLCGYGDFDAASEIDVDALALDSPIEAQRLDPMPDPETLSVGEMIDLLTVQERAWPLIGTSKIVFDQYNRRDAVRSASSGFLAFEKWVQRTYGRHASIETALEFRGELCRSLGKDFPEANAMPLLDAVRQLELPEAVSGSRSPRKGDTVGEFQVVLLVHGIRTHADWAPMVKSMLEAPGRIEVIPIKYGYFDVFRFWFPLWTRKAPIERVWKEFRVALQKYRNLHSDAKLSVIAHSFGTYIIAEILKRGFDLRIHRLIFCGSIVPQNFPWEQYQGRFDDEKVINECGKGDLLPVLAQSLSWGYGASGTFGFGSVLVKDRFHAGGHSQYFDREFVEESWEPFIRRGEYEGTKFEVQMPTTPWWVSVLGIVPLRWTFPLCLVAVVWFVGWSMVQPPSGNGSPETGDTRHTVRRYVPPSLSYVDSIKLMDLAAQSGDWSGVRNRLIDTDVRWTGYVLRSKPPDFYVIQPQKESSGTTRELAIVSLKDTSTHATYLEGESITVWGRVSRLGNEGINIAEATIEAKHD
jgi:pimeloyl-ACP methyl ester carboxylesterase